MPGRKRPRPLLLFYVIVVYVLIQFGWWSYLLIRLNRQVNEYRTELSLVKEGAGNSATVRTGFENRMHKDFWMVIGEGSVFLILLLLGIARTRNSFRQEAELNERQKNFILSITHELRSPLASIRLQLETLNRRDLPKEKQAEIQANAIEDIDRLNGLIGNILLTARLDTHVYEIRKEQGNLSSAMNEIADKMSLHLGKGQLLKKNITDNISTGFDLPALQSILNNLIENAAKYSPDNSTITVGLGKKDNEVNLTISDEGPGIRPLEKEKIFERFYRSGDEETRNTKGTGLGLYIVKHLVDSHGWAISVNNNITKGCTFVIRIPNA